MATLRRSETLKLREVTIAYNAHFGGLLVFANSILNSKEENVNLPCY